MTDRYDRMFSVLAARGEGAFIPFVTLGDPDPGASHAVLEALVDGGADALELGLPFSDPVADGPVIQAAATRALAAGTRIAGCWELIARVRRRAPDLPIGLLVYANLVVRPGPAAFYAAAREAGVDSVLVADLPLAEAAPFEAAAIGAGIAPVLIAPPNASADRLAGIAARSRGYTYVTSRAGVTGDDRHDQADLAERIERLRTLGAPPPVVGFGISTPAAVRAVLAAGAAGAIAGSAVVRRLADPSLGQSGWARLRDFVAELKAATRPIVSRL